MNNLKDCPFCGGDAFPNVITTSCKETIKLNGQDTFHGVNCASCHASIGGHIGGYLTSAEAIYAWNTRVGDVDVKPTAEDRPRAVPTLIKAGDKRVMINGEPIMADCFIVSKENYESLRDRRNWTANDGYAGQVIEAVQELRSAESKWPNDPHHAKTHIDKALGELAAAILNFNTHGSHFGRGAVKEEAIAVAAISMRFLISIEDYVFCDSLKHYQH